VLRKGKKKNLHTISILKTQKKTAYSFLLKRLPYKLLQFLAAAGAKSKKKCMQTIIKIKLKNIWNQKVQEGLAFL
jgi:hypothetical protein